MKRYWIAGGVLAVLVGMGFVMPAIAQWRDLGVLPMPSPLLLLIGGVLTLSGVVSVYRGVRTVRAS
jgi:hypothetical protein